MPTYVYKFVDSGETIEVQQGFHDATLTEIAHPQSGEVRPVKKVFTPVGVTFKGSGFFKNDNRSSSKATAKSDGGSSGSTSESSGSSTESTSSTTSTKRDSSSSGDSKTSAASTSTSSSGTP